MLDRIAALLDPSARDAYDRAADRARSAPQPELAMMIGDTLAIYRAARMQSRAPQPREADRGVAMPCGAALRAVDAAAVAGGCRRQPAPATPRGALAGIARVALRIRHTGAGKGALHVSRRRRCGTH